MEYQTGLLLLTAASIGFFHTLMGPDHYLPFIAISKARSWSIRRTISFTTLCGVLHVLSSVFLGLIGIGVGVALNKLEFVEAYRGNVAAWILIIFGAAYMLWGIYRSKYFKQHQHPEKGPVKKLTPWILMIIFLLGPCEPLIPILMFPAANNSVLALTLVTLTFALVTVGTMLTIVILSFYGIRVLPKMNMEKYVHAIAGFTILICGLGIQFLGI